jgi:hypothetical protein
MTFTYNEDMNATAAAAGDDESMNNRGSLKDSGFERQQALFIVNK